MTKGRRRAPFLSVSGRAALLGKGRGRRIDQCHHHPKSPVIPAQAGISVFLGQEYVDPHAFAGLALDRDLAAMALNDVLDDGEP